jgi:hypothetical protein
MRLQIQEMRSIAFAILEIGGVKAHSSFEISDTYTGVMASKVEISRRVESS